MGRITQEQVDKAYEDLENWFSDRYDEFIDKAKSYGINEEDAALLWWASWLDATRGLRGESCRGSSAQ